jgi:hypothetical protein
MLPKSILSVLLFAILLISSGSALEDQEDFFQKAILSLGYSSSESFENDLINKVFDFYQQSKLLNDTEYEIYCNKYLDERFEFSGMFLNKTRERWSEESFKSILREFNDLKEGYPIFCTMRGKIREGKYLILKSC